jgi:choline dehydrogenase-like flavoprotein
MSAEIFDFIIVGGGLAGSALASRLQQRSPSLSVLIIEAGADVSDREDVLDGSQWLSLLGSDLDWAYNTVPQRHVNDRVLLNHAGRALGGGSVTNAGTNILHFIRSRADWIKQVFGHAETKRTMTNGQNWWTTLDGAIPAYCPTFERSRLTMTLTETQQPTGLMDLSKQSLQQIAITHFMSR